MSNERMRIDKWLWVARFFKKRSPASTAIASHKIRCNGDHVKPARDLKVCDELEITIGQAVFVVIVQGMAEQRRPAPCAVGLLVSVGLQCGGKPPFTGNRNQKVSFLPWRVHTFGQ